MQTHSLALLSLQNLLLLVVVAVALWVFLHLFCAFNIVVVSFIEVMKFPSKRWKYFCCWFVSFLVIVRCLIAIAIRFVIKCVAAMTCTCDPLPKLIIASSSILHYFSYSSCIYWTRIKNFSFTNISNLLKSS